MQKILFDSHQELVVVLDHRNYKFEDRFLLFLTKDQFVAILLWDEIIVLVQYLYNKKRMSLTR